MNKEDLINLKEKINKLSDEEKKQRDFYLKSLSSGELQGPPVGYASIDKPWLKYYTDNRAITDNPIVTNVYQLLYDNNKDNLNQIALMYFGARISYNKLFKNIDKAAKALKANGVKKGDFVTICSALNPEVVYMFYALAKIGAVANFMSPFFDKKEMIDRIADCNSRLVVVMDKFYPYVNETIDNSILEKTVLLPTLNSSPLGLFQKKLKVEKSNEILWNDFIKEGKSEKTPETVSYEKQMPLVTVYSSGTTGASKAIVLTHDSFCNTAFAYPRCNIEINRGDIYYQIIPPWFSTGINTSTNLILSQGATLFMDPRFDRKVFVNNMLKHNPTGTLASVTLFQAFLDDELLTKGNLSNLKIVFQGGEKMEMQDKENIEKVLKQYNCKAHLMNGYGQCECGAGFTTQTPITPSNTSVGIPIPGVKIGIFDENDNEQLINTRGEIYACTPCGMKEYYSNPEATKNYFYFDEAKQKWSRTGDIGKINNNGELEIFGRAVDYSIINDKKIYNFDIESIILKNEYIQNCDVFLDDSGILVAHIILKNDIELNENEEIKLLEDLQQAIYDEFGDIDYVPCKFKFRDSFPIANFSKKDIKKMKSETEGFKTVDNSYLLNVKKL